jgi:hypothetical protein
VPGALFAVFQLTTTLLLLSAASSSFQAGPGLLKALARRPHADPATGILPAWMGRINRFYTPFWGVVLYLTIAAMAVIAAGARDQVLVLFYAVSVFLGFLAGLVALAHFAHKDHRLLSFLVNGAGAVVVAFTLLLNLARGWPLISLGAALLIAGILSALWRRAGRPQGITHTLQQGEQ